MRLRSSDAWFKRWRRLGPGDASRGAVQEDETQLTSVLGAGALRFLEKRGQGQRRVPKPPKLFVYGASESNTNVSWNLGEELFCSYGRHRHASTESCKGDSSGLENDFFRQLVGAARGGAGTASRGSGASLAAGGCGCGCGRGRRLRGFGQLRRKGSLWSLRPRAGRGAAAIGLFPTPRPSARFRVPGLRGARSSLHADSAEAARLPRLHLCGCSRGLRRAPRQGHASLLAVISSSRRWSAGSRA